MLQNSGRAVALVTLLAVPVACDSGTDPVIPASVDLTAQVDMILKGQSTQLVAIVLDENGDPITDPALTFSSSAEAVATVDEEGLVTGVGDGEVAITAAAGDQTDLVDLFIFDPGEDPCGAGLRLLPGDPVRSTLEAGDCPFGDGTFLDLWFFELAQQTAVTIEMTSADLDTYLFLEREEGMELVNVAEDDDGAGGTDSRIQMTLAAGSYWIVANHWPAASGAPAAEGTYTLTLTTGTAVATATEAITMDARVRVRDSADPSGRVRER